MKANVFDFSTHDLKTPSVIESSAGTGKTYSIVQIYLRLVIEKKLMPDRILVVTFTEAATSELRTRIRDALTGFYTHLSEKREGTFELLSGYGYTSYNSDDLMRVVSAAIASFDEASIFTIHGFCKRVLRDNAFEYNTIFNAELIDDIESITSVITRDYIRNILYGADDATLSVAENAVSYTPLMKILNGFLPKNGVTVVPDGSVPVDLAAVISNFKRAFDSAKKTWNEHSNTLLESICSNIERFKKNIISEEKVSAVKAGWDAYFASENPFGFPLPAKFELLTPDKLASALKKEALGDAERYSSDVCAKGLSLFVTSYNEAESGSAAFVDSLKSRYLMYAKNELLKRKNSMNLWSFDDLIVNVRNGLISEKGGVIAESIRKKYQAALIDEFQDTDPVQCDIFERIFNPANGGDSLLFYIGDPKQAIYSFRGADIYSYLKAKENKGFFVKTDNHRSLPGIVKAVNAVFETDDPFLFDKKIDYMKVESKASKGNVFIDDDASDFNLVFIDNDSDKLMSAGSAKEIIRGHIAGEMSRIFSLAESGKAYIEKDGEKKGIVPGDCAVIVRDHAEASGMRGELRRRGIPSVLAKSASVMSSPVKTWIDLLLRAVYERREGYIRAALASPLFGYSASELSALSDKPEEWETVLESFRTLGSIWEGRGFMPMFSHAEKEFGIMENVAATSEGARNATDLLHIAEIYHRESISRSLGPSELVTWSSQEGGDSVSEEHRIRLETDDDAVKIITVHASKGLEYPVVFVACGWDSRPLKKGEGLYFHDPVEGIVCDLSADPKDEDSASAAAALVEQCSENLRLYYVALTRAAFRCYCYAGRIKGYPESAAGYLFHSGNTVPSGEFTGLYGRYRDVSSRISEMTDDEVFSEISDAAARGAFTVKRSSSAGRSGDEYRGGKDAPVFEPSLEPVRDIRDDWKISSFSYIVSSGGGSHDPDYDEDFAESTGVHGEPAFPAGPSAGNCIHEIFEKIDFRMDDARITEIAEPVLRAYDLFSDSNIAWICSTVRNVLSAKMPLSDIPLGTLHPLKVIKEMEFYFPAALIDAPRFRDAILLNAGDGFNGSFVKNIASLDFERFAGFLRGFVDLVFEHEGRYFIVDWKSNYIGDDASQYGDDRLCREMDRHLYTVQASVYSLALHMHLSARLPGYDYDRHFGGVIYVFVRGVRPESGTGLWSWRPEKKLVSALESLCIRRPDAVR
jgi:exodeoxyribonuclease V beta subunit